MSEENGAVRLRTAPFGFAVPLIASGFWFGRGFLLVAGRLVLFLRLRVLGLYNGCTQRLCIYFV
jgi:hypothetical protein